MQNPFIYLEALDKILTDRRESVLSGKLEKRIFLEELQDLTTFADTLPNAGEYSKDWVFALIDKHMNLIT